MNFVRVTGRGGRPATFPAIYNVVCGSAHTEHLHELIAASYSAPAARIWFCQGEGCSGIDCLPSPWCVGLRLRRPDLRDLILSGRPTPTLATGRRPTLPRYGCASELRLSVGASRNGRLNATSACSISRPPRPPASIGSSPTSATDEPGSQPLTTSGSPPSRSQRWTPSPASSREGCRATPGWWKPCASAAENCVGRPLMRKGGGVDMLYARVGDQKRAPVAKEEPIL